MIERCRATVVASVQIGAGVEQERDDIGMPLDGRLVEGRHASGGVADIGVGPANKQQLYHIRMSLPGGFVERGASGGVCGVGFDTAIKQKFQHRLLADGRWQIQWKRTAARAAAKIRPMSGEEI